MEGVLISNLSNFVKTKNITNAQTPIRFLFFKGALELEGCVPILACLLISMAGLMSAQSWAVTVTLRLLGPPMITHEDRRLAS